MAKTRLKIAERTDIFLYMTRVENLFINEFLPDAPGEYVKVYLFGLMYAQYEEETDNRILAMTLGMTEEEIEEAWDYWAARGLVRKSADGSVIEFNRMVERLYGRNTSSRGEETGKAAAFDADGEESFDDEEEYTFYDFDSEKDADEDDSEEAPDERLTDHRLRQIFARYQEVTGRTVSRRETGKLEDAIKVYGIKPEVLFYAIDYCAEIETYSVDYIFKVALRWKEEGCEDIASVKELLARHSARNSAYREVFKALGFNRLSNPGDRAIMDPWFDEMGFKLDEVLDACRASAGIREPSLRYVNKVLENKMLERGGVKVPFSRGGSEGKLGRTSDEKPGEGSARVSRKVLRDYFEHIREEDEAGHRARLSEASESIPGLKEILAGEKKLNEAIADIRPGGAGTESRAELRNEKRRLEERKRTLLEDAGLEPDYLERKYRCDICRDTGYTDEGKVCSCCRERAEEAYVWNMEKNNA